MKLRRSHIHLLRLAAAGTLPLCLQGCIALGGSCSNPEENAKLRNPPAPQPAVDAPARKPSSDPATLEPVTRP